MGSPELFAEIERALAEHFGQRPTRASVSFLGVEPIDILRFEPIPGEWAYLTLGMSRRPMSAGPVAGGVSVVTDDGPRAELMLHLRAQDRFGDAWRRLAVLAAAPAVEGVVHVADMTLDLGGPIASGSRCSGVVVGPSAVPPVATDVGPVDLLLLTPATATELAWARVHGSPALRQRWAEQDVDLLDLGRRAARLD